MDLIAWIIPIFLALVAVGVAVMGGLNHLEADEADQVVGDVPNKPEDL